MPKTVLRFCYRDVDDKGLPVIQRINGVNRAGWLHSLTIPHGNNGIPPYCRTEHAHETALGAVRGQLRIAQDEIRSAEARLEQAKRTYEALALAYAGKRPLVIVDAWVDRSGQ